MTPGSQNPPEGALAGAATPGPAPGRGQGSARDSAHEFGEQAKAEGRAHVEQARSTAADSVDRIAQGVQAAASRLREDDVGHLSEYVEKMAGGMSRLSSSLREKSGDDLLHEVGRLARENPALFITGGVAIGVALGRFARASDPHRKALTTAGDNEWSSTTSTPPTGTAAPAGTPGSGTPANNRGGMH